MIKLLKKTIHEVLWRKFGLHIYNIIYRFLYPPKRAKYFSLSEKRRGKKVEPWAFIRVKNEITTISACLESILPVIKKGVIGYSSSDDGTDKFILDFCKKNKGFIPFKYEYDVIPANDIRYKGDYKKERRLDYYYNAVLNKIPNEEWFIKIDGDHVYDTNKLEQLLYLPKDDNDCVLLSRLNLHYNNKKLFFLKKYTCVTPGDHWLIRKTPNLKFTFRTGTDIKNSLPFYAWEHLDTSHLNWIKTDLFNWHFPLMKHSHKNLDIELIDFDDYPSILDLKKHHIPKDMVDKDRILKIVESFNFSGD